VLAAIVVGTALLAVLVLVVDARLSWETNKPLVPGYLTGWPLSAAGLQPLRGGR
jgi:hypothetical protein